MSRSRYHRTAVAVTAIVLGFPAPAQLVTRWAADVSADRCHPEYPRPHLVRAGWQNLNGRWQYAITAADAAAMGAAQGEILVPFPLESKLSGVGRRLDRGKALWYRRTFTTEVPADGEAVWLRFGAVDWDCRVLVNGKEVGRHRGGFDRFGFDITGALVAGREQELVVRVEDPSDDGFQPRGKQVREPRGIWYTPSTGIWQTVWLERVPRCFVRALYCVPDLDRKQVTVVLTVGELPVKVRVTASGAGAEVEKAVDAESGGTLRVTLDLAEPRPWSPSDPFLYDLQVRVEGGGGSDQVKSYFGMRKIAVAKDSRGVNRLFLNGAPLFQLGPLDQGFWPDGLLTAPTDEALRFDLQRTKDLGFNMVRKHVKVEPERWYHHCDRIGLLVWQDMPSGDRSIRRGQPDIQRTGESAGNYYAELAAMIDGVRHHPCVVAWVPFNEGWGQFDTNAVLAFVKERDPTRLVDGPSGWVDRGTGDMHDIHSYPGPSMPALESGRAAVLGEFGGLGLPVEGHLWWDKRNWGYRTFRDRASLQQAYEDLIAQLERDWARGLAAAVYTQTTDVEGEVNGLMTYDRAVLKFDADRLRALHTRFYRTPPVFETKVVLATSEAAPQTWRYTTTRPEGAWQEPGFDDRSWREGPGGFGRDGTPGAVVRTEWTGSDLWLRRSFDLADWPAGNLFLRLHHDEDVEVFVNGIRVLRREGFTDRYIEVPANAIAAALRRGANRIAVHCRQTRGGQYVDVGLLAVEERRR